MARSNLSHGSLRFESAVIIHRLRSYRPIDQHLFVVPRVLIPEPGPTMTAKSLTMSDRKVGTGENYGFAL
jgi:hypothetical protein